MLTQGKFPTYIDSFGFGLVGFPPVSFFATDFVAFALVWVTSVGATFVIASFFSSIDPDKTASKSSFANS